MAIGRQTLLDWKFPDLEHRYTVRDTMLYALGAGAGQDPMDRDDLRFVYEDNLAALPTMAVVLGYPGFWLKDPETGVNWQQVLHGEQGITLFQPIPREGTVIGRTRVVDVIDKGAGRGALLYSERDVIDARSGAVIATLRSTTFLRADGGFGGPSGPTRAVHPIPERAPDAAIDLKVAANAALIYRLSGDYNPLHADPDVAKAAGFKQPILHGLCTFAVAGRALLRLACDNDPARLRAMDLRFTAPVYPGETVRTEIWHEGNGIVSFRARVIERDLIVLNNGRAEIH